MLTLPQATEVMTFLQSCVEDNLTEETENPVEVAIQLEETSRPLVYDPYNDRLKIYGVTATELIENTTPETAEQVASKLTAYARPGEPARWRELGFRQEGVIRGFFEDSDAHLWAAYTDPQRENCEREALHQAGVEIALSKSVIENPELPVGYSCQVAELDTSREIADLMTKTFEDYPTPIHENLVEEQIRTHANHFRVVRNPQGQVAAVASAELDHERMSAEMTDCATRPIDRGRGLMAHLLKRIEQDLARRFQITDLYTLARADEVGMNCVFRKLGYDFSGRLVNNCRMPNGWESMNVWCRETTLPSF